MQHVLFCTSYWTDVNSVHSLRPYISLPPPLCLKDRKLECKCWVHGIPTPQALSMGKYSLQNLCLHQTFAILIMQLSWIQ